MIACLFSFGKCNKKKKCCKEKAGTETSASRTNTNTDEVWMQYDETKCDNPWQISWFIPPTEEQMLGAIKSELLGRGIKVLDIQSSLEKDLVSCEACNCPNGRHFYVLVNKTDAELLKTIKFYEVEFNKIPKTKNTDTTK